jgi:hypothetical protein
MIQLDQFQGYLDYLKVEDKGKNSNLALLIEDANKWLL